MTKNSWGRSTFRRPTAPFISRRFPALGYVPTERKQKKVEGKYERSKLGMNSWKEVAGKHDGAQTPFSTIVCCVATKTADSCT